MRAAPFMLEGDVDIKNYRSVTTDLIEYAHGLSGANELVVDCSKLTFIDSSGLNALVRASHQTGRSLVLEGMPQRCRRVLEVTGLDDFFQVQGDGCRQHARDETANQVED